MHTHTDHTIAHTHRHRERERFRRFLLGGLPSRGAPGGCLLALPEARCFWVSNLFDSNAWFIIGWGIRKLYIYIYIYTPSHALCAEEALDLLQRVAVGRLVLGEGRHRPAEARGGKGETECGALMVSGGYGL